MLHVIMSAVHESHPASVISEAIACLHWSGLEEASQETGSWSFDRAGSIGGESGGGGGACGDGADGGGAVHLHT